MHRRPLIEALRAYGQRLPDEAEMVERMLAFVTAHPRCFERALAHPGHVTGSAWILAPDEDAVLLTHHRKLDIWVQLGGHADGDPDVAAVARREGLEESGLDDLEVLDVAPGAGAPAIFDVDIHRIPARRDEPEHLHFDVRYAFRAPHREIAVSDESHDLAWVPLDALEDYTREESMLRMARKWRALAGRVVPG